MGRDDVTGAETLEVDLRPVARLVVDGHAAAPCAVVAAAARRGGAWRFGGGAAGRLWPSAEAPEANLSTVFDLASVSKPVTALTLARLARAGTLARDEPLGGVVDEARRTASAHLPLDLFTAHRAGLDAHRTLYAPLVEGGKVDRSAALFEAASARRAGCEGAPPGGGFSPVYSDLGYLLLGEALARRAGVDLDGLLDREVSAPLGLELLSARLFRARHAELSDTVAPTEVVAWRGGTIRGVVHDENALALSGEGSSGHAGLFGRALDVARLGVAILDALRGERESWLSARDLEPLVRRRPGGTLRAGFDGRSAEGASSGRRFGPETFGHLGFTGTSLWMDPEAELVGVLLTNRVHPSRSALEIRAARPAAYDAIAAAMTG